MVPIDEYRYLRSQYQSILQHCEYLIQTTADVKVLEQAREARHKAATELQRLNRMQLPRSNG
ncbi:MAG TPA: hypothetical protein VN577_20110 [Terriglobales bacterium]|nr:hypothetical protein [Terriglobales bacterium]